MRKNYAVTTDCRDLSVQTCGTYRGADKSLARPTSRFILFDASLVLYIYIYTYIYIYSTVDPRKSNGLILEQFETQTKNSRKIRFQTRIKIWKSNHKRGIAQHRAAHAF
jgi:hypothetical protein